MKSSVKFCYTLLIKKKMVLSVLGKLSINIHSCRCFVFLHQEDMYEFLKKVFLLFDSKVYK